MTRPEQGQTPAPSERGRRRRKWCLSGPHPWAVGEYPAACHSTLWSAIIGTRGAAYAASAQCHERALGGCVHGCFISEKRGKFQ